MPVQNSSITTIEQLFISANKLVSVGVSSLIDTGLFCFCSRDVMLMIWQLGGTFAILISGEPQNFVSVGRKICNDLCGRRELGF